MLLPLLITLFSQFQGLLCQTTVDANGISLNDKIEAMERMLLTPQQPLSIITPCNRKNPLSGEQTAAEWIRIIFHDTVTHNVK